jgi:hypothetical protein
MVVWICDELPPLNLWNFPEWRYDMGKTINDITVQEWDSLRAKQMDYTTIYEPKWKEKVNGIPYQKTKATLPSVIADLASREVRGIGKYGKALDNNTGEDMMQHLYEELLDAAMYIKTLINQREVSK